MEYLLIFPWRLYKWCSTCKCKAWIYRFLSRENIK